MVSSVVGVTGNAGQANYAAAKSAVMGLTREMSMVGAGHGVRVNCVVPGYFETDATAHLNSEQRTVWLRRIPMQRPGNLEEVVEAIIFFALSASYVTGQCLSVDGGLLAAAGTGLGS
jgi:3-oxoacyl-[acyl-carrier protein] reductase